MACRRALWRAGESAPPITGVRAAAISRPVRHRALDHDPIRLNRIMISSLCLSMIFSENRSPLFRIMLLNDPPTHSEAEAKPDRRIDRAPIEEAIRQATIHLREHDPGIGIKLLRKLPIDDERNG